MTKIQWAQGDIRPQALARLGVGLVIIAAVAALLVDGAWSLVAACFVALGVVFGVVGLWAGRKIERGEFERPANTPRSH